MIACDRTELPHVPRVMRDEPASLGSHSCIWMHPVLPDKWQREPGLDRCIHCNMLTVVGCWPDSSWQDWADKRWHFSKWQWERSPDTLLWSQTFSLSLSLFLALSRARSLSHTHTHTTLTQQFSQQEHFKQTLSSDLIRSSHFLSFLKTIINKITLPEKKKKGRECKCRTNLITHWHCKTLM